MPENLDLRQKAVGAFGATVENLEAAAFELEKKELLEFKSQLDEEIGVDVDVVDEKGNVTGKEFKPGTLWAEIWDQCQEDESFKGLGENKCG